MSCQVICQAAGCHFGLRKNLDIVWQNLCKQVLNQWIVGASEQYRVQAFLTQASHQQCHIASDGAPEILYRGICLDEAN
ncbi:hypothetical protein BKK79_26980 [Cupriavidus sp. USMAA2-4]|nr:hypothetical protein BKK79_26980 [Cupriavidus sp. USMAA2-4]